MNIALIGSGGREHALCQKIVDSHQAKKVFCIPGNAGTAKIAINIQADFLNFKLLLKVLKKNNVDLVVVGPEEPLVMGIVDFLKKRGIRVFGPNKYAAKLEGSKAFMKKICEKNKIPTANFKVCKKKSDVLSFLKKNKMPVVVKADGLAAGKGVSICQSRDQVIKISNEIFLGKFKSSRKLILEEFLTGEEASYFIIVDKKSFSFIGSAQDHKRVGENDTGKNTGGMGAYSPSRLYTNELDEKINERIIKPTLDGIKELGVNYCGFLYIGLMIVNNEPYLIEFNVRMGDPECQTILPILETDLGEIVLACCEKKLHNIQIKWKEKKSVCIVLCSKGYPDDYKKNVRINQINDIGLNNCEYVFHAGTKIENGEYLATGGRVLNIVVTTENFKKSKEQAIKILNELNWDKGFFRKDIAYKVT